MPLKCSFKNCTSYDLAQFDQIAFYQDLNTSGWNLALGPEFVIPGTTLPTNIALVATGDNTFPYNVVCVHCHSKVGQVNLICGFEKMTVNFSWRKVYLLETNSVPSIKNKAKWSKIINVFPNIRRITANIPENVPLVAINTIHFHGVLDLEDIFVAGKAVSSKSKLSPKDYQWRAFVFACFNNVLLCLPTGMGKTLIANMLMKAYHKRNAMKGQVFIVPTVVLVEQQASVIEQNTGLKVIRRSGEEFKRITWAPQEICVCTPAMLLNAIKIKQIDISELSLLIFDEVHEANSPNSQYGLLLPYITQCPATQRPKVLGLTASPSCANSSDMRQSISSLCNKLGAIPYTPLHDDYTDKPNSTTCRYVSIHKTSFEVRYEEFVIDTLNILSRLHNFFEANWKLFQSKLCIQIKIDTILQIISHSKLVANDMADIQLLQVTGWMNKWIDSLNILQISGPLKLIQFIQADLDFVEKNSALSTISSQLPPIANQLRLSVEQMCNDYQIGPNSPKMEELLTLLKSNRSVHQRILIFVERRNTAERLCRRLKEDSIIKQLNPIFVVGNAKDGPASKDLQQNILEMFRKGECQLLVATSVLEQGIDVAMCGLVICFDGVKSMKSMIQSRGRARKDAAMFVAFVEAEKQRKANELTQMEITMDYAIRQLMKESNSVFDHNIAEELDKFLKSDHRTLEDYSVMDESDDEDDEDVKDFESTDLFKLRFFNYVDSNALVDHIKTHMSSPSDRIRSHRRFIQVYFSVQDVENDSRIKKISTLADSNRPKRLRSWFEITYSDPTRRNDSDILQCETITFDLLTGFYFEDFTTVSHDSNNLWCENYELKIRNNEIVLTAGSRHFQLRSMDFDAILVNDTANLFEIYFCLRNPPAYFIDKELAHFNFATRPFNLYLKRNSSVDSKLSWKLRDAFHLFSMNVYNVCHLKQNKFKSNDFGVTHIIHSQDYMQDYLIKVWHSRHAPLLPTTLPKNILKLFCECSSLTALKMLLDNTIPVRFQKFEIKNVKDVKLPFLEYDLHSDDYVSFGRVNVTPSRFIYLPMQPIQKNRVFRYFPNPTNFLLISFTDENGGNPWRSSYVCEWFRGVLQNGIKIGKKNFTFLGCSNSQLREGRCWFSTLNRDDVYKKIGDFPDSWSAGRKLTRLALAFASSFQTVALNERYLSNVAVDVEMNGVNFSDGIGKASHNLVEKLQTIMDLQQKPSAFQIRVGGIKGVVSVYDQEDDVTFRKSMKKFESKHNMLEVLSYSRSIPLFLNRHVILLLSSYGVPDEVFLDMQHDTIVNCMDTLVDEKLSLTFVKSNSNIFDWELLPLAHLVREPFFSQLLISNVIDLVSGITNHSHIPVANGRILMGVMDETHTLEYGEIYAHIVESNFDYEVEGQVLLFRNPCVLPSDIRILNARKSCSSNRLRNLYTNCLVIPSQGPSSHASECSGGDLDGDLYYVIWDDKLIPKSLQSPGEKVVEVKTKEADTMQICNTHESMMQFYCDYVSKNQLGIIANAHLATADDVGMLHSKSIEIAKYVTAETDAPKKGFTVGKIPKTLLPTKYPDFMQKSDKPSYRSKTILGKLFRQSQPILEIFLEKRAVTVTHSKYTVTSEKISIENCYAAYCYELKTLLQSFDLQSEVDLFSGTPMWKSDYLSTYKQQHQLRQNVSANAKIFWQKWKRIFDKWRVDNSNNQNDILKWYDRPKSSPWPILSFSFLAMPYVNLDECNRKTISQIILESTLRWVFYNKMRWLSEWRKRYHIGETVMSKLGGIECHFYGSAVLGLNEEYSDIDLCAAHATHNDFEKFCEALKDLDHNAENKKKPHACVRLSFESLKIDLTSFMGGVTKTYGLASTFDENPGYWAALRVLIEWARRARIVKSCGSEGFMTVVSFCHLFIYFATSLPPKTQIYGKPYTLARFGGWIESTRESTCGTLIYDFLKQLSSLDYRIWLMTKIDPLNKEPLIKRDFMDELCKNAEIALCILAVHNGDVQKLFEFCSKKRLFRLDKRYIDPITSTESTRNLCLQELKTICNPKKCQQLSFELIERSGIYYVEVSGDQKLIPDVEKGLNKIHCKIANTRLRLARKKSYHIVNSTIIILEFGYGPSTEVSFSSYVGDRFNAHHTGIWKSKLKSRNAELNMNWREYEYERYKNRFLSQIESFSEKQRLARKSTRYLRFFGKMFCNIRCGNHYFFHIPESLLNTFETVSLEHVTEKIAHMEEVLDLERQENIVQDLNNYNSLTLMQSYHKTDDTDSLALMPLHELKVKSTKEKQKSLQFEIKGKSKNVTGIRHSFYTIWSVILEETKEFAALNGFKEIQPDANDCYTNINIFWRQRELVVSCDKIGMITEISHRKVRWLSATLNRFREDDGGDVRIYLECQAPLDDDESCLKTVIEYLNQRSIFTETFAKQLEIRTPEGNEPFPSRPLIPDIFHFNWRFRSMRLIKPVAKFANAQNDVYVLNEIYDGVFQVNKHEFEWFPKHFEIELHLSMDEISSEELCKKSYEMALQLFDHSKKNL